MKIASPKPTCADRYIVRLLAPVAFDGNVVAADSLVSLSDVQAVEIIFHERGIAADESALPTGGIMSARPRALMEWADAGMSPRQRKKWRPSRVRNRIAQPGFVRLDAGTGIVEQVSRIVGR